MNDRGPLRRRLGSNWSGDWILAARPHPECCHRWCAGRARDRRVVVRPSRPNALYIRRGVRCAGSRATLLIHHFWGTWITTPIAQAGRFSGGASLRIAGHRVGAMLLDQEYGLLPYAPIFVLAGAGLVWLRRNHRSAVLEITFVTAAYVASLALPMTNMIGWTGGWSPPARFLTPVIPLIAIGMAAGLRRTPRLIAVPLIVVQIAIDAYFWQHPKYLWNNGTGMAAVCTQGGVPVCGLLPSFDPEVPRQGAHDR